MDIKNHVWKWLKLLLLIMLLITVFLLAKKPFKKTESSLVTEIGIKAGETLRYEIVNTHLPLLGYTQEKDGTKNLLQKLLLRESPLYQYAKGHKEITVATENSDILQILKEEGSDEDREDTVDLDVDYNSDGILKLSKNMEEQVKAENAQAAEGKEIVKQQEYQWDYYTTKESLIKDFYAIDSTTEVTGEQLNLEKLLGKDMTLKEEGEGPHILIYHTHSQEGFADSVPGDPSTTIVGAGEYLAMLLREEYGFKVLHHTGEYDVEARDYAYSYALPEMEQVLKDNPNIDVVIDLHRDAVSDDKKLVTNMNGKSTAQFMFFNGLSHTKKQGDIEYLKNPYIEDNLAFSFQMQVLCNEYYPGVTRRIYLKGLRYNMHLRPKTLLIELGAQTNTNEEIHNAVDILAHVLAMCLRGETLEDG